jgi:hypothetical protein
VNGVVTRIDELDQTVVVLVEDDYVAVLGFFGDPGEGPWEPWEHDDLLLLSAGGAAQLGHALLRAADHAADAEQLRPEVVEREES